MPKPPKVEVGQGVTLSYPQDRYPYRVTRVLRGGLQIEMQEIKRDGPTWVGLCNGFPVHDHRYTPEEVAEADVYEEVKTAHWSSKKGVFRMYGEIPVRLNGARFYRNYAD